MGEPTWGQPAGSSVASGQPIPPGQTYYPNQSPYPTQPMATPFNPETALWPDTLPKEPTGWSTLGRVGLALLIFFLPLSVLTAIGYKAGPPTKDFEANSPITIEGTTHEITFELPWACTQDLSNPAMQTFSCSQDGRQVQLTVHSAETVNDLEVSAKRGAREATLNRFALDFPSMPRDILGGKAALVTTGTGLFGMTADSLAASPNADDSGFVFNITEFVLDNNTQSVTPAFSEHLLESISFKKIEEGEQ